MITNRATGKWFVLRGIVNFHEIAYRHVSGTIYEFTANESGQPFVIEDASGRVIVRDRGNIRHTALFDTLGDAQPGAVFIEETHTLVPGPHPGFDDPDTFCDAAISLTTRRPGDRLPPRRESGSPSARARRRLPSRPRRP